MMNRLSIAKCSQHTVPQLHILIEKDDRGNSIASVLEFPDCQATAETREKALQDVEEKMTIRLKESEILSLELKSDSEPERPWMKFAGVFKDDPQFDEYQSYLHESRNVQALRPNRIGM